MLLDTSNPDAFAAQPASLLFKVDVQLFAGSISKSNKFACAGAAAETTIVVRPHLEEWSDLEDDQIVVQQLDLSGMRVISHVLSQSVALDYFNW